MFEENEFDNIKDGYSISEYVGGYEKYLPSMKYLQYTKSWNEYGVLPH